MSRFPQIVDVAALDQNQKGSKNMLSQAIHYGRFAAQEIDSRAALRLNTIASVRFIDACVKLPRHGELLQRFIISAQTREDNAP